MTEAWEEEAAGEAKKQDGLWRHSGAESVALVSV